MCANHTQLCNLLDANSTMTTDLRASCEHLDAAGNVIASAVQDVTKQQAKERAAARRLVAGQSTLDKYLSPGSKALDKQVQKHMAKTSKAGQAIADSNKQAAVGGKKRSADSQARFLKKEVPKKPRRKMIRLLPVEDEEAAERLDESSTGVHRQADVVGEDTVQNEDNEFQPFKKRAKKLGKQTDSKDKLSKERASKTSEHGATGVTRGTDDMKAACFQDFQFCHPKSMVGLHTGLSTTGT